MPAVAQENTLSLEQCLKYAIENNHNLKKSRYDRDKAAQARNEVLGSLLPQINGSANLNANLKKAKFVMPNFVNNMLPPQAQDPNASKYMTVEMGTTYNANVGVQLNQQVFNMGLFNTMNITKVAEQMATLGEESTEEDIIAQTATLYYGIQATEYAASKMNKSIELMEKTQKMMKVNYDVGIVKKVDIDRIQVNLANLNTQRSNILSVIEVQKNLLKLQMGYPIDQPMSIQPIDLSRIERETVREENTVFSIFNQVPYRLMDQKLSMAKLQKKSAMYEYLPTLSLMLNYQYNGMSDEFFKGSTNYWYPTSMVGVSLRIPIFSGFSRRAKVRQSTLEINKAIQDREMVSQSLQMAFTNAQIKLSDAKRIIRLQTENQQLAEDVFTVAEDNFVLGISSMADVISASQSLVQAQMSYVNALNDYMTAYISLKKANGTIKDLINNTQY